MGALAEMQDLLGEFLAEAGELLEDVDRKLVALEADPRDTGLLNTVYRGFHTIKGGAGFLDAAALVELCHRTENLFDRLRGGALALTPELLDTILAATAEVRRMFDEMAGGLPPSPATPALMQTIAAALDACASPQAHRVVGDAPPAGTPDWPALYAAIVPGGQAAGADASAATHATAAPKAAIAAVPVVESTIRIDTARFDQILNLTGEVGLTRNRIACLRTSLLEGAGPSGETLKMLDQVVGRMDMLVGELQNAVMKARMQPVERVFQKYNRLARDVARQIGKEAEVQIDCAGTEIDKSILDALNDPLVHLVRNAVDHGIEPPQARLAAGKPRKARIRLAARQDGDRIRVEIADDGAGMRAEVIRAKAIQRGLIGADAAALLDEQASFALIMLPGFSTRDTITDLSGRGVGMDVVKNSIERLKGRIEIESVPGKGTRFVMSLPLTLAILPVLSLGVCGQRYALPLAAVREVLALDAARVHSVSGQPAVMLRGEAVPLIDLAAALGRERAVPATVAVVARVAGQCVALGADACYGQDEVMLKSLEGFKPRGVAGATLGDDGALVLVLDLPELLEAAAGQTQTLKRSQP